MDVGGSKHKIKLISIIYGAKIVYWVVWLDESHCVLISFFVETKKFNGIPIARANSALV